MGSSRAFGSLRRHCPLPFLLLPLFLFPSPFCSLVLSLSLSLALSLFVSLCFSLSLSLFLLLFLFLFPLSSLCPSLSPLSLSPPLSLCPLSLSLSLPPRHASLFLYLLALAKSRQEDSSLGPLFLPRSPKKMFSRATSDCRAVCKDPPPKKKNTHTKTYVSDVGRGGGV